jgi:hypothetical protein
MNAKRDFDLILLLLRVHAEQIKLLRAEPNDWSFKTSDGLSLLPAELFLRDGNLFHFPL